MRNEVVRHRENKEYGGRWKFENESSKDHFFLR